MKSQKRTLIRKYMVITIETQTSAMSYLISAEICLRRRLYPNIIYSPAISA